MARVSGLSSIEGLLVDWVVDHRTVPSRLPVDLLSREKAAELERLQADKAMRAAYEAELTLALAVDSPVVLDDHPAAGTGSWTADAGLPEPGAAPRPVV